MRNSSSGPGILGSKNDKDKLSKTIKRGDKSLGKLGESSILNKTGHSVIKEEDEEDGLLRENSKKSSPGKQNRKDAGKYDSQKGPAPKGDGKNFDSNKKANDA